MKPTQHQIDRSYAEGRQAYRRYVGTHGPTLKPRTATRPENPHPCGSKLHLAWQRGYAQDVRRVIA